MILENIEIFQYHKSDHSLFLFTEKNLELSIFKKVEYSLIQYRFLLFIFLWSINFNNNPYSNKIK